jgi:predicted transcriptional regulator
MKNKNPIIDFIDIAEDLSRYLVSIYKNYDKNLENKIVILSVYNASKKELKDVILENPELIEEEIFDKYEKLVIQRNKRLTNMTAISRETGIPRTTVNRVVKKYLEQGILCKKNDDLYIGKNFRIKYREFFNEIDRFYNAVKNKY